MSLTGLPAFVPDWDIPVGVKVLQTERGVGPAPFGGFNLGDHVGDDGDRVNANREQLTRYIGARPVWLHQVHGVQVAHLDAGMAGVPEADAATTRQRGIACTIMTADCLPVLVADRQARVVGAAHAGWRGLAAGVIQALINDMTQVPGVKPDDLSVWLGPAIGPDAFEVGEEVVRAFTVQNPANDRYFRQHPEIAGKFLADLPGLAVNILYGRGVEEVVDSGLCTVSLVDRFYSYRRDKTTGRMASLIWLE